MNEVRIDDIAVADVGNDLGMTWDDVELLHQNHNLSVDLDEMAQLGL